MNSFPFPRNVVVLGSTGSVGRNAVLELFEHREQFRTVGLVARNSLSLLAKQATLLNAEVAVTTAFDKFDELTRLLPASCQAAAGEIAMTELVTRPDVDVVLCAIVGTAGIRSVLAALASGKLVALASKELLCMAGDLVMAAAKNSPGGGLIPVDSEHSGLFQCLHGRNAREIDKLWLTASGGPFRDVNSETLKLVTLEEALRHPVWSMGAKTTIDSATMMNKALELIEAHYLFDIPEEQLGAVIHPQSKVHALVELTDGTFLAQLSAPDMRMAIRYGMSFPERLEGTATRLSLPDIGNLDFQPVDTNRFPSILFAREAIRQGGSMPAILNAANDVAVERFKRGEIRFTDIWRIIEATMGAFSPQPQESLEQMLAIDREARAFAET